jgi:hypothetical protein
VSPVRTGGQRRGAAGQAMVEFVIAATLFLIPVFLIIPLLGKYADMKSAVIQAARYNAWERTVWYGGSSSSSGDWEGNDKSESQIKTEMVNKFLTNNLWYDRAGSAMMASNSNAITNSDAPGTANTILGFAVTVADALGPFTLEMKGLYAGTASLSTASITPIGVVLGEPSGLQTWESLNLNITDKNVILANGWGANGADHVKRQVQGLTPTSILANPVIDAVRWVLVAAGLWELTPLTLEFGKIVVDEVPPDRLQ